MIASWSSGTLKQYDKPLRLWWDYCKINGVQLLHAPITQILEFLSGLTDKVNSYATLNTYRSALSLIMNNELGSDQRIRRLFKGVDCSSVHMGSRSSFEVKKKKIIIIIIIIIIVQII